MSVCIDCGVELDGSNQTKGRIVARVDLCTKCANNRSKKYYQMNRQKHKAVVAKRRLEIKTMVYRHYSERFGQIMCANPFGQHEKPYTDMRALSLDHINGGGNKQRRMIAGASYMAGAYWWRWIIRNNYPEGFQVLCMNCQRIKQVVNNEYSFPRHKPPT